ncbi:hypothetical protein TL16_g08772 [Triparma laevis f. inornata]|uniref:Uncharacterized protein n=1 Tax=Triparma laevis f. inornata TaxID=1714386 RepID=A0A9W7AZ72_9STRA|nr:hypothetical protein TL16_g08772 [Triparma laevis f. inornata]
MPPIICLYFGSRYLTYVGVEEVKKSLSYVFSREQIYGGLGALACLQFFCFTTLLMCVIPATYRRMLWSTETVSQFSITKFQNAPENKRRIKFTQHPSMWAPKMADVKA